MNPLARTVCGVVLLSILTVSTAAAAQRVVSLDHCADQYLLALLPAENIAALSPDAEKDFSYFRHLAKGIPQVRPRAEEILLTQADVVVRSYGGDASIKNLLQRANIETVQLPWVNNWQGAINSLKQVAAALGASERAADIEREVTAIWTAVSDAPQPRPQLLYLTPGGVTTGSGSLIHELMTAAGFDNFQTRPGWQLIPLERLMLQQPDVIAAAFFQGELQHLDHWSAMRHPVAQQQLHERPVIQLHKASIGCSAWFAIDAFARLSQWQRNQSAVRP